MKPTLETIAEKTGYSTSTVSRVLTGKAEKFRISETAAAVIRETAAELGYTPNILAQNLRNGKTETIGLVVPDMSNPYFAEISSVIVAETKKHGYTTIVTDTMENESAQKDSVCALVSRKVEAVSGVELQIEGKKLLSLKVGGEEIQDDKLYGIGSIDFLLRGGDKIHLADGAKEIIKTDCLIRDCVLEGINALTREGKPLEYHLDHPLEFP